MAQPSKKHDAPIQSPHAALQAMLPRLRSIGPRSSPPPFFNHQEDVADHLKTIKEGELFSIVPVWAIDHRDLQSSAVIKWTFARFIN